jgi:hypothetical protein
MIEEFITGMEEKGIRYVLVGGMALNLHGIPRPTYDIDLSLALDPENLSRFWDHAQACGFKPRLPISKDQLLDPKTREAWIKDKNLAAVSFLVEKPYRAELDVLIDLRGIGFEELCASALRRPLGKSEVVIASRDALIKMKAAVGRDQDLRDIEYLRRLG